MRKFDSILLSEDEPIMKMGTLWLKRKRETPYNSDANEVMKDSLSLWYFGPKGWESLIDFDTKYTLSKSFNYYEANHPIQIYSIPNINTGVTETVLDINLYDGSREPGNCGNLVMESGLKSQVDKLQEQIDILKNNLIVLQNTVMSNTAEITGVKQTLTSHSSSLQNLSNRVSSLENH